MGLLSLSACTTARPNNISNICSMFEQYPDWYWAIRQSSKKWGMPPHVIMAIIHQESHFNATIKPPRRYLLGFIPWFRPSTAYGYSQALDGTWAIYKKATGKSFISRDNFADAVDFIAWFGRQARARAGISLWNTYGQYLAYHEGVGGYLKGTYRKKLWLMRVAKQVKLQGDIYWKQLRRLSTVSLKTKPWWRFW